MKKLARVAILGIFAAAGAAQAQAEYATLELEIDIAKPATEVWSKVGNYCDIEEWLGLPCVISSGDGGVGTVRDLFGGVVKEVLVAQTELSYGYAIPAVEDSFYAMYHGFMEARPTGPNSSKMLYTLMWDQSNLADQAAKDADIERRRGTFQNALNTMKEIAAAP